VPFVESDGVSIHYEVRGKGPAILFHTGAGGDSRMWEQAGYEKALQGFRMILMDQRGRGKSDRPDTVESHRMEHFVADLGAVLDDAGVDSTGFWGYSNGVYVGLAFGVAHPKRLNALVGTGTLWFQDVSDLGPVENPDAFIAEQVAKGGVAQDVDGFQREDGEHFPEAIDRNVREGDPRMYALDRIGRRSWHGPKSLYPSFRAPVLMISGEKEVDEGATAKALAALPNGRGVRIPGVGHLAAFYRSDLSVPHAIPFLWQHLG
jgi:pimeloyl-ACP methyl ester carboxylesterase